MPGVARLKVVARGGNTTVTNEAITVENADSAMLVLAGHSSFNNFQDVGGDPAASCEATMKAVSGKSYETLLEAHIRDYQEFLDR